jgi:RNA polymerase sigma-70 factor (ECF subfamily)
MEVSTSGNDPRTSTTDRIPDPATADIAVYWDHEWQKNLVDAAIQRVKEKVSPRQYEIFYLHVAKNFPAAEVAATLNVNLAQVYLAKHRISALVKKEVRRLEKQMI